MRRGFLQGKLRIGLGEESVVSALAHAQLLHREGGQDTDGALANRLERAVQSVKQAVSQCPSYDVLIPALLTYPLEVRREACSTSCLAHGSESSNRMACEARRGLQVCAVPLSVCASRRTPQLLS